MGKKLKGKQHKLDADKDGDIDAKDFKKLRDEEEDCKCKDCDCDGKGCDDCKDCDCKKNESLNLPSFMQWLESKSHEKCSCKCNECKDGDCKGCSCEDCSCDGCDC